MSFAGASKHVRVLENAGLVTRTIHGRTHLCRLQAARLAEADAWLRRYERFWNEKLDTLEALLRADDKANAKKMQSKRAKKVQGEKVQEKEKTDEYKSKARTHEPGSLWRARPSPLR